MATLDEIRRAIAAKFGFDKSLRAETDYWLLAKVLIKLHNDMPKDEFNKLRQLMLNFTVSSNILALQLIYKKYVKES